MHDDIGIVVLLDDNMYCSLHVLLYFVKCNGSFVD